MYVSLYVCVMYAKCALSAFTHLYIRTENKRCRSLHSNTYRIISTFVCTYVTHLHSMKSSLSPAPALALMRCNKQKLQVGHVEAFSLRFLHAPLLLHMNIQVSVGVDVNDNSDSGTVT